MWTILFLSALSAGPTVELTPLGGQAVTGELVELNGKQATIQTGKGPLAQPLEQIATLSVKDREARPASTRGVWIDLADGCFVVAEDFAISQGRAAISLAGGKTLEVPARDVQSVRFQPQDEASGREWSRILGLNTDSDLLIVRKDDALDYHAGVIREVSEAVVQFELDKDLLPVKRAKIYGLRFHQAAGRELPAPLCRLAQTNGSRWAVRSISLEGGKLRWETLLGLALEADPSSLAQIDFSQGKIVYLSDLVPESTTWTPYFAARKELPSMAEFFAPRRNRALQPGPLQLGGKSYEKGLALRSRTEMVYRLPDGFRRLLATVGIDDRVRPRGNVRLVIRGDERVLLDIAVTGDDPPKPIDLELGGAGRLTILVDYGEDMDLADHLDLCEARMVK